jgi:hypothetical protein
MGSIICPARVLGLERRKQICAKLESFAVKGF